MPDTTPGEQNGRMAPASPSDDSFSTRATIAVGDRNLEIHRLDALAGRFDVSRLPYAMKVLLENLLRHEDGRQVHAADIEAVAGWAARQEAGITSSTEIAFSPERVLMQDFTGVPGVVDLAAMRDALATMGGDPTAINPLVPVELVIDHSVIAESSGLATSFATNVDVEYERNIERYQLLRWAQQAFDGFRVVPPGTGICHQVNLEYLARVVFATPDGQAFPDTLVGTDSHTTMVNGLGVLGWGVGGIEAEAAMLGQPLTMLVPPVVGLRLTGELPEGTTATDLVLTIAELLRHHGVVGKFVEVYGPGLAQLPLENRATIGNMAPEYGATCVIFPDRRRDAALSAFHRTRRRPRGPGRDLRQGAGAVPRGHRPRADVLGAGHPGPVDGRTQPGGAVAAPGPGIAQRCQARLPSVVVGGHEGRRRAPLRVIEAHLDAGGSAEIADGHVVIAAITSCTNTSNPQVMLAAGLLAQKAVARGLRSKPWVKTSLAPGSRVVMDYYERSGLRAPLETLGFQLVGFGCTTCIGNSGPLLPGVSEAVHEGDLSVAAVLSGNRNFEGRIHPDIRLNYLASPPLVVAYALAGTMDLDLTSEPLGTDGDGVPVYLRDLWPSPSEVSAAIEQAVTSEMFRSRYASVFEGDDRWKAIATSEGDTFNWDGDSTYVLKPPFFEPFAPEPAPVPDIVGARVLAVLGDSVTTDHISPAGSIRPSSPPASTSPSTGWRRRSSTPTAPGGATTRS